MKAILKIYVVGEVNYEGFGCDEIESILENLAFEQMKIYPIFLASVPGK